MSIDRLPSAAIPPSTEIKPFVGKHTVKWRALSRSEDFDVWLVCVGGRKSELAISHQIQSADRTEARLASTFPAQLPKRNAS